MPQYPHVFKNEFGKVTVYRSVFVPFPNTKPRDIYKIRWKQGEGWREEKMSNEEAALERAEHIANDLQRLAQLHARVDENKLAYYVTCEYLLEGKASLLDVVQDYVKRNFVAKQILVGDAVGNYLESMRARELSKSHVSTASFRLQRFAKVVSGPLNEVTVSTINDYLQQFPDLVSRRNERAVLSRFFSWCQLQGWVDSDRKHAVMRSDAVRSVAKKDPGILSPRNMTRLLAAAKYNCPELIPYLVLGGFCGMRRMEIGRLVASQVDLDRKILLLSSEITKTRRRRVVHMPENVVAWLKAFWPADGQFVPAQVDRLRANLCKALKLNWPTNCLRHSYVSYAVEHTRNAAHVAEQCGHSLTVLQNSYKSIATPEDAEKWFSIVPEDLETFRPVQQS